MFKGGPFGWGSKKLPHVGLSAFHNEYTALRHAASLAMWLRQLLPEMGCEHLIREPTKLYGDNMAANQLTAKDFISSGNQYIYQPYHWIKEFVKNEHVTTHFVGTKDNLSDIFTKPVPLQAITTLLDKTCGYDHTWENFSETKVHWSSSAPPQISVGTAMAAHTRICGRKTSTKVKVIKGFNQYF